MNADSKHRPAFTLMELLVVIALIGVMAGLAIYFVPSFNTSAKSARGASNLQSWINAARQSAIRDQSPRGIRLLYNASILGYDRAQYLEQPDDLGGGRFYDTKLGWLSLTVYNDTSDKKKPYRFLKVPGADFTDGSVQAGDYIELSGTGVVHYILAVPTKDKLEFAYDMLPEITAANPIKNFRIIRRPRVVGDEVLEFPRTIYADWNAHSKYATAPFEPYGAGNLDIMFSPSGTVLPGSFSRPHVALWIRSSEYTTELEGEPTLIVVYANSGLVASYAANVGSADPYDLVKK